jgi:putative flippase GtrA
MTQPRLTQLIKFGVVGGSGVIVNLSALAALRSFGLGDNLASALAIEVSIISNFILNDRWTFRDRVAESVGSVQGRAIRFQLVSLVGALAQWLSFICLNLAWVYLGVSQGPHIDAWSYYAPLLNQEGWRFLITTPPRVGDLVYASQLIGIVFATAWNFLANHYWTWGKRTRP